MLPGWPVLHPLTAEKLREMLDGGVAPASVVWLNEAQRPAAVVYLVPLRSDR